jgi:hypothetical protein
MKRIVLAASALALLVVPAAGADPGRAASQTEHQRRHREVLVRGTAVALSPISVRASIGTVVTCEVRNRALIADLAIGDHVLMKCVAIEGRLVLRRLAIHPAGPPSGRPTTPTQTAVRGVGG